MKMKNIEKSTKSLIKEILGKDFPLTLKQIHNKIIKNISYQAVHKIIKELIRENIVEKIDKQYFLNKNWVKEQTDSFSKYYSNYFNISYNPNQLDDKSKIQMFRFYTLREVLDFIVNTYVKTKIEDDNNIYVSVRRLHPLIPPTLIQVIKKLQKNNQIYIICKNKAFTDRWAAKLYSSLGVKVKIGVDIPLHNAICVGDSILQYFFFFGEKYKEKVHSFSDKFKDQAAQRLIKLTTDIFYRKAEMYLIINKYPFYKIEMKKRIMEEFGTS